MRSQTFVLLLVCGCGGGPSTGPPFTTAPPELTVLTYNMYYGLAADILPESTRTGHLTASAQAIINALSLTDARCRIEGAARQIAAERPDVIGLQEALLLAYMRDPKDRSDDSALVDFTAELIDAIARAGGPRYEAFSRENAAIAQPLPRVGGIRLVDRGAILVNPRLRVKKVSALTYATLEPASDLVPGTSGVIVRGALHVQIPFPSGTIDLFNTHLQSGREAPSAAIRAAQASELAAWIEQDSAADGTVVLTGDLNDVPTSVAVKELTARLVDTYGTVGAQPGYTAYQAQSLDDPTNQASLRIDFVMVRAGQVESSQLMFNAPVGPCNLWPSDHFGVLSRFKTGASLPPVRPSE